MASQMAKNS